MRRPTRAVPVWGLLVGLLLVAYAGQLLVVRSLDAGAAIRIRGSLTPAAFLVLAPVIHTSHEHLLRNAIAFVVLGRWTENRVPSGSFAVIAIATGYLSLYLPRLLGSDVVAVGFSGVTQALTATFAAHHAVRAVGHARAGAPVAAGYHVQWVLVTAGALGLPVARLTGLLAAPRGVAVGAHATGLAIGVVAYLYWRRSSGGLSKRSRDGTGRGARVRRGLPRPHTTR